MDDGHDTLVVRVSIVDSVIADAAVVVDDHLETLLRGQMLDSRKCGGSHTLILDPGSAAGTVGRGDGLSPQAGDFSASGVISIEFAPSETQIVPS